MVKIFVHPKPMRRHTSHVVPADAIVSIALPDCTARRPGLYLKLHIGVPSKNDGAATATQLVVIPMDQLDEIEAAIKLLRAASKEHWQQIPLGMPDEGRVVLLMYHGREVAFTVKREPATMHGARPIIGLPVGATHWRAA